MAELTPQEADYEIEHFNQTKQPLYYGLIITFFSISFIMVCLRLLSRKIQKADLALDDYFSVAGMIFTIVFATSLLGETYNGMGKHILAIDPKKAVRLLKWEVVDFYANVVCTNLVKLSIIALIARVFNVHARWFRLGVWLLAICTVVYAVASILAYSLQCRPFSNAWSITDTCRLSIPISLSSSTISCVIDVCIFSLPQPLIWRLQMPLRRRMAVSAMVFVGLVATIVGILRSIWDPNVNDIDASYHTPANFFSFMEVFLGTICSCLPSLPALVRFVRQGGLTTIMSRLRSTINRTGTSGTSTAISKDPTGPGFKTQSSGTATSAAEGSADFFGDTIPWSGLPLRNGRVHPDQARFRDLSRQREWPLSSDLTPADARPSSSNERHVYIRTDVSVHQVARDEEEGRRETRLLPPVHVRAVNGAAVG